MMRRRWCRRLLGGMVGVACLVLAGCAPGRHLPNGSSEHEVLPQVKAASKAPEGEKPTLVQEAATKPQESTQPSPPPERPGYRLAGDDPLVRERINLYQQKKISWDAASSGLTALGPGQSPPDAWNECRQDIELALAGYQGLQTDGVVELNPWEVVSRDLGYFAKDCDQVLLTAQAQTAGSPAPTKQVSEQAVNKLWQTLAAGQYQEVVNACELLAPRQDRSLLNSRELKIIKSRALVKLGRLSEAAGLLMNLLAESGQAVDPATIELRRLTGDVLLAEGRVEEARQVYEGLVPDLAPLIMQQEWVAANIRAFDTPAKAGDLEDYRQLLQTYLRFDGQQVPSALLDGVAHLQGPENSSFAELARMMLAQVTAQSQAWARSQLAAIRGLTAANNLAAARELLQQLIVAAPATMQPAITQLEAEIAQAELMNKEPPPPGAATPLVSPWDAALALFEQQKYDEAIAGFQMLLTSEHSAEAKVKIAEASELAAAAMRRQAAALYAKAKKTIDPTAKQQGMLHSRALLLDLIEKYPTSSIVDKARQNLKTLDGELGPATTTPAPLPATGVPPEMDRH